MSTVRDPQSLAIGLATVRVAPYVDHIDNFGVALTGDNSIGYISSVDVKKVKESVNKKDSAAGKVFVVANFVIAETVTVDCEFAEQTISNTNMALGSGTIISENTPVNGEIGLSTPADQPADAYYRVEVAMRYKDKTDSMTFVLPKCRVSSDYNLAPSMEDLAKSNLQFSTAPAYEGAWLTEPIGKIIYHN